MSKVNDVEGRFIDRLVKLHEEKAQVQELIKEVKAEAKGQGVDAKAVIVLVKRRMETAEARAKRIAVEEEMHRLEVALGEFGATELGASAIARAAA